MYKNERIIWIGAAGRRDTRLHIRQNKLRWALNGKVKRGWKSRNNARLRKNQKFLEGARRRGNGQKGSAEGKKPGGKRNKETRRKRGARGAKNRKRDHFIFAGDATNLSPAEKGEGGRDYEGITRRSN